MGIGACDICYNEGPAWVVKILVNAFWLEGDYGIGGVFIVELGDISNCLLLTKGWVAYCCKLVKAILCG